MKIVIVGDGKVGYTLTEQLSKENHDLVIIDSNPEVLRESLEKLDVMVVTGNGASLGVQRAANVNESDLLIAATSSDEINLLACMLARKLGCKHTISRVRNPEYAQQLQLLKEELGLSMAINPELAAAREIFRLLQFPSFLKMESFAKGRVELVEFKLKEGNIFIGKRLDQLQEAIGMKVLVCAVERNDKVIIPNGDFELELGDKVNVTAPRSNLAKLIKKLKINTQKIRNVMIIGGSRIAAYLAEDLIRTGVDVKIVEKNINRCKELAEILPDALIINGDGTLQDLLHEEGITETDAVISLTNMDEENLIISMLADSMGVSKTITKINRSEYSDLFKDRGIGSIISTKQLTSNGIIRYVRAMGNTEGGSVKALHRIVDGKAEALEFSVKSTVKNINKPLAELNLKSDILIACISRSGKIIIPKGDDAIMQGDTVIVITTADRAIKDFNDIFID